MKKDLVLNYNSKNVFKLEDFIWKLEGFNYLEKEKLIIIASEIFDNIISYAKKKNENIYIRIKKNKTISILFLFFSENFEMFINKTQKKMVYYDPKTNRYRGLGMKMCYNLSQSIHYRITINYDAIRITI